MSSERFAEKKGGQTDENQNQSSRGPYLPQGRRRPGIAIRSSQKHLTKGDRTMKTKTNVKAGIIVVC